MKHLKWIASSCKKLGFDSDACNHIRSALLSTCSVPIQACQFGKFQRPVNFSIGNIFAPELPLTYQPDLEMLKKDSHSHIETTDHWLYKGTSHNCQSVLKNKKKEQGRDVKSASDGTQFFVICIEATYSSNIFFILKVKAIFSILLVLYVLWNKKKCFSEIIARDERMWITTGLNGAVVKDKLFWNQMYKQSISKMANN